MSRLPLAVLMRDHQTGSMNELPPGRLIPYALARDPTAVRHLSVLVADANETELRLTIQRLGEAWPFARDLVVEGAVDGAEVMERIRRSSYALVVLDWNV